METEDDLCNTNWGSSSSKSREPGSSDCGNSTFAGFTSQQKWEDASILDYEMGVEPGLQESIQANVDFLQGVRAQAWDPRTMLSNLSFMEQKIHQLQDLVHLLVGRGGQLQGRQDELAAQQQQLITTDLTSIIIQLISTAESEQ